MNIKSTLFALLIIGCSMSALRTQAITLAANPTSNNGTGGVFISLTTNTSGIDFTGFSTMFGSVTGSAVSIEVYTRTGAYTGFTASSAGWTLLGTVSATSAGTTIVAPVDLTALGIQIPAATTQSFYFHSVTAGGGLRYFGTGTTSVTSFSDANVALFTDVSRTGAVAFAGTQFSPRALTGSIDYNLAPLPVKWLSVSGKSLNNTAAISWEVVERDVRNYALQKQQGDDFITLQTINSLGDGQNRYQATDAMAFEGATTTAVYRIMQTDVDGRTGYSAAVLVKKVMVETPFVVYPNPFTATLQVDVSTEQLAVVTDVTGKTIAQLQLHAGSNTIDTRHWQTGVYTISCAGETIRVQKL